MGMGGAYQDQYERDRRRKAEIQAEAMASEKTAVYNLGEIRKLEKRIARLESEVLAHAKSITTLDRMLTAMCHEAEGAPPDAGMLEAVQ